MPKSRATYLGLDIGTSGVKAVLIDENGTICAESLAPLSVSRPFANWSEQDPQNWWQACLSSIDHLSKSHAGDLSKLRGIGLSGQMHGATLLDKNAKILRPAMLWNDGRASRQCVELETNVPQSRNISGNIAMAGFTAPKILWVQQNEPRIFEQISKVLLPKDYIRFCLSSEYVTDMSDASGTLWLNVKDRCWSDELLEATGLNISHMPALIEGSARSGFLKPDLVSRWSLNGKIPIAGGGGDNAASACGIGAIRAGEGFVSLGTSGVLFVANETYSPNTENAVHAFCHAIPSVWHQMGVILSATDSLNWLAKLTGKSPVELSKQVEENYTGPAKEVFLPYLSGERTPHNNAGARGSFVGLSHLSTPVSMAQAVMEGVAFAFKDSQRALLSAGTSIDKLFAVGGGANSPLWLKMIATNLNTQIHVPQAHDLGAAFGAARLAICAANGAKPQQVCTLADIQHTIQPDPDLVGAYQDQYQHFTNLYPAIEKAI